MCEISLLNVTVVNKVQISCYSCGTTVALEKATGEQLIEHVIKHGWKASRLGIAYCPNCPFVYRYPWATDTSGLDYRIKNVLTGDSVFIGKPKYRAPGTRSRRTVNLHDKARAEAQKRNEAWRKANPDAPIPDGID